MRVQYIFTSLVLVQAGIANLIRRDEQPQAIPTTSLSPIQTSDTASVTSKLLLSNSTSSFISAAPSSAPTDLIANLINPPHKNSTSELPLQPTIGPGNILAGIFLLIPGIIYGFFAIKHLLIHNFLSISFVGSLAVACLIIFVQNPPTSQAQNAGYAVGTIFSGMLLGGLSSPFASLFEGIGCLLGGFCMSMWLLTIKENGLFANKAGKTILICAMSLAIGALGFTRFTRDRALLICIPFSAATAIVLGIDCFTRGGLKEFWIYIWGFNMNIFPLDTNSYPMTRTMRVESSLIIVIFLISIVINMQLWKILQEHLNSSQAIQQQREKDLEQEECEVGLRTEAVVAKERKEWERCYGDSKDEKSDSSISETPLPNSRGSDTQFTTDTSAKVFEMNALNNSVQLLPLSRQLNNSNVTSPVDIDHDSQYNHSHNHNHIRTSLVSTDKRQSGTGSNALEKSDIPAPSIKSPRNSTSETCRSKNDSGFNTRTNSSASKHEESNEEIESEEDAESSLVNHLDDLDDMDGSRSITRLSHDSIQSKPDPSPVSTEDEQKCAENTEDTDTVTAIHTKTSSTTLSNPNLAKRKSLQSNADTQINEDDNQSLVSRASATLEDLAKRRLSSKTMKAMKHQKTFEWAKESTLADIPQMEDIERPSSPGVLPEINQENPAKIEHKIKSEVVTLKKASETRTKPALKSQGNVKDRPVSTTSETIVSKPKLKSPSSRANLRSVSRTSLNIVPEVPVQAEANTESEQIVERDAPNIPSPVVQKQSQNHDSISNQIPDKSQTLLGLREQNMKDRMSTVAFTGMSSQNFSKSVNNLNSTAESIQNEDYKRMSMGRNRSTLSLFGSNVPNPVTISQHPSQYPPLQYPPQYPPIVPSRSGSALAGIYQHSPLDYSPARTSSAISVTYDAIRKKPSRISSDSHDLSRLPGTAIAAGHLSTANLPGGFDSHQPQPDNTVTNDQRAIRLANWRVSLNSETPGPSMNTMTTAKRSSGADTYYKSMAVGGSEPVTIETMEAKRDAMLREKREQQIMESQREQQKQHKLRAMQHTLKGPEAAAIHAHRLSLLQSQVKM